MTQHLSKRAQAALYALALATLLVLAGLVLLQWRQWQQVENSINRGQPTVVWNFFQFELELHKLMQQVQQTLDQADNPQALSQLHLRYNLFASRYDLILDGQSQALLRHSPRYHELLAPITDFVHEADTRLNGSPISRTTLLGLHQQLQTLQGPTQELLLLSNRAQNQQNTDLWKHIRTQGMVTSVSSVVSALLAVSFGLLALHQLLWVVRRNAELHQLHHEADHRAKHDPLTNLYNRKEFTRLLGDALNGAQKQGLEHALLYIDLDRFKVINEACGHHAGDQVLQEVTKLVLQPVRGNDTVARLGDDEFGIILYQCNGERAHQIGENICQLVEAYRYTQGEQRFHIGASIGLVNLHTHWISPDDALQAVGAACLLAKREGGGRVHSYLATDQRVRSHLGDISNVQRLQLALDQDRLRLFWQRIVPLQAHGSEGIKGEVLLRLYENGKFLTPDAFLPAAERYGLATEIDRWVVRHLIDWLTQHPELMPHLDTLAVNLSGQSVGDPAFQYFALQQIKGLRFSPRKLICEVTETSAITNMEAAIPFFAMLREQGVRVSLDDFGSGMSSFGYLKSLPADYLKIDGQFMRHIQHDIVDQATVRAMCDVARSTAKHTVAEWVENAEVADMLRGYGVDYGQGYHWHRPEPIESLLSLLPQAAPEASAFAGPHALR